MSSGVLGFKTLVLKNKNNSTELNKVMYVPTDRYECNK